MTYEIATGILILGIVISGLCIIYGMLSDRIPMVLGGMGLVFICFIGFVWNESTRMDQVENRCEHAGGVLIWSDHMTACIDIDSILNLDDQ